MTSIKAYRYAARETADELTVGKSMQRTGIIVFDHATQAAGEWVSELADDLEWADRQRCYELLKATLHAIRDYLDVNEVAAFGRQLSPLIRGLFYDDWDPSIVPARPKDMEGFLSRIGAGVNDPPLANPDRAIGIVLDLIRRKITPDAYQQMYSALQRSMTGIWK